MFGLAHWVISGGELATYSVAVIAIVSQVVKVARKKTQASLSDLIVDKITPLIAAIHERIDSHMDEEEEQLKSQAISVDSIARELMDIRSTTNILRDEILDNFERSDLVAHARFRAMSIYSSVPMFELDKDGKCSFVNSAWCEITGISLQGALGDGWFSAVDPAARVDVVNAWENSFSSRSQFGPIDFLSNVGVEVRVQAFPLLRYNGELEGYVGVMRRKNTLMS